MPVLTGPRRDQPLVAEIADARRELESEQIKEREDQLGVAARVGGVLDHR
jgi:hypothetical protein